MLVVNATATWGTFSPPEDGAVVGAGGAIARGRMPLWDGQSRTGRIGPLQAGAGPPTSRSGSSQLVQPYNVAAVFARYVTVMHSIADSPRKLPVNDTRYR